MKITKALKSMLLCSVVLTILIVCGTIFVGCNKKHEHNVTSWSIVREATCTLEGEKKGVCTDCGEEVTEAIAKLPHTIGVIKGTATCMEDGLSDGEICVVCSTILKEQVQVTAPGHHDYGEYEQVPDDNGSDEFTYHKQVCKVCGDEKVERCAYVNDIHKPTCVDEGYTIHNCVLCGWSFKHDPVPATGHNYENSAYAYVTSEDSEHYIYGQHRHKRECLNGCGTYLVETCEVGNGVVTEPTCTTEGFTKYTCEKCNNSYDSDIQDVLSHNFGEDNIWKPNTAENYTDNHTHTKTCITCGLTETTGCSISLTDNEATCDKAREIIVQCPDCGRNDSYLIGEKLEHNYVLKHNGSETKEGSKHYEECSLCGNKINESACEMKEQITNATCDSDGKTVEYCDICKASYSTGTLTSLGHKWKDGEGEWIDAGDGRCYAVCENNPEHRKYSDAHIMVEEIQTRPDCVNTGVAKHTCKLCKKETISEIEALGHMYGDSSDPSSYDINNEGHIHKCQRLGCEAVLPRVGHTYTETNFCDACGYDGIEYQKVDNHYIVLSGSKVRSAKKIIIPETHSENGEGALPVRGIIDYYDGSGRAFASASIKEVVLPRNLEFIGNQAFKYCRLLQSVSIAEDDGQGVEPQLKEIRLAAFMGCISLKTAYLPTSLKTIGDSAFRDCTNLNDITIEENVNDIGSYAFDGTAFYNNPDNWTDNVLYINNHLIKANSNVASEYTILAGTINISVRAFENCSHITKLTIPGSVKEIDAFAFTGCTGLKEVVFTGTFDEWMSIVFGNSDSSPMNFATILTISGATDEIFIPNGVTKIPVGTFRNNSKITKVTIPSTVIEIGDYAFYGCTQLATIVDTGCNFKRVGKDAFTNTNYYNNHFDSNGNLYIGNCLIAAKGTESVKRVEVKEDTISIAAGAFKEGITEIVIAASVQYIGAEAFTACTGLTSVKFNNPKGWMAFNNYGIGRGVDANKLDGSAANLSYVMSYTGSWTKSLFN